MLIDRIALRRKEHEMLKRRLAVIAVSSMLGLGFALHERSVESNALHVAPAIVAGPAIR